MEQQDFVQYVDESAVGVLMRNVYIWMTMALAITAGAAWMAANSEPLYNLLFTGSLVPLYVLFGLELVLVLGISAAMEFISMTVATLLFVLYSVVNGVTLSCIFLLYDLSSIATTFVVCSGTFAAMAAVGTLTKRDLSTVGRVCYMGLFGIIIASLVNIFAGNSVADLVISAMGVVIFTGLTAYDAQKIKDMLYSASDAEEEMQKIALVGALALYLDFINLFLYLLRFFGRRK